MMGDGAGICSHTSEKIRVDVESGAGNCAAFLFNDPYLMALFLKREHQVPNKAAFRLTVHFVMKQRSYSHSAYINIL
jgi:hypothetical protein